MNKQISTVVGILIILLVAGVAGASVLFLSQRDQDKDDIFVDDVSVDEISVGDISSREDFSFEVFTKELDEKKNIFISPYSIHTAMLLAYIGADGNTKEEMKKALVLIGMEEKEIKKEALELKVHLEEVSESTEVSVANALFLKENIPFLDSYKKDGEKYFDAKIDYLPSTGESINKWVSDKTNGLIPEIIDSGPISDDVISYLINAIYFKGFWENEFNERNTEKRLFYGVEEKEIDMMQRESSYFHTMNEEMQAVTIEYKEGDYLFHAFMPKKGSLSDLYREFIEEGFGEMRPRRRGEIILRLPKFTMRSSLELSDTLKDLGIRNAFNIADADFSQMADLEAMEDNIFINSVIHKSFIEVEEEGTEAAAVTAVEYWDADMPVEEEPTPIVEFNKPFFFVIEEAKTETILFMGQLVDPTDLE